MRGQILKNRYYIMRHGESEANREGLIVSDPSIGTVKYGLTEKGREQAAGSLKESPLTKYCFILSSPFLRAKETAEIVRGLLGTEDVNFNEGLRERYFGEFDLRANHHYKDVWALDVEDPDHQNWGVESVIHVLKRMQRVVMECEGRMTDQSILLVSHGDPLQILSSYFMGFAPQEHRQVPHLHVAEVRELAVLK